MTEHPRRQPIDFREMTREECMALLASNDVGRLAFTFRDHVDIQPLNYVMHDGDLLFRTTEGSKVDVLRHHPWVAFEVDEVDGVEAWRSVVVHGTIYHVDHTGPEEVQRANDAVVERLQRIVPAGERGGAESPVLLRLHVDRVSGREARR